MRSSRLEFLSKLSISALPTTGKYSIILGTNPNWVRSKTVEGMQSRGGYQLYRDLRDFFKVSLEPNYNSAENSEKITPDVVGHFENIFLKNIYSVVNEYINACHIIHRSLCAKRELVGDISVDSIVGTFERDYQCILQDTLISVNVKISVDAVVEYGVMNLGDQEVHGGSEFNTYTPEQIMDKVAGAKSEEFRCELLENSIHILGIEKVGLLIDLHENPRHTLKKLNEVLGKFIHITDSQDIDLVSSVTSMYNLSEDGQVMTVKLSDLISTQEGVMLASSLLRKNYRVVK